MQQGRKSKEGAKNSAEEEQLPTQWSRKVLAHCVTTPSHAEKKNSQGKCNSRTRIWDMDMGYGICTPRQVEKESQSESESETRCLLLARLRARYANLQGATLAAKELQMEMAMALPCCGR